MIIKIKNLKNMNTPRQLDGQQGFEVQSSVDCLILPGKREYIPIGLEIFTPEGYILEVRSLKNLAKNLGLLVMDAPGKLSTSFTGEAQVLLHNTDQTKAVQIVSGNFIAEIVPVLLTEITIEEIS